jgi:hypothetical protein
MRHAALAVLAGLVLGTGARGAEGGSAVLLGTVRDDKHVGLPGVRVQVFLDGYPLAAARSDSLGAYRVVFPWFPGADSTVLAWWTAEEGGLVPEVAVLRESAAARRLGFWGPSIPRIAAPAESLHDAVLHTRAAAARRDAGPDTTVSVPDPEVVPAPGTDGQPKVGSGATPASGSGRDWEAGIEPADRPGSARAR